MAGPPAPRQARFITRAPTARSIPLARFVKSFESPGPQLMLPDLASLVALQQLDSAAEAARRRLSELPGAEEAILGQVASAQAAVDEAKSRVAANAHDRRELEKQ